eukprot:gnl/MRDRNA2_/MRDRNA2_130374_c0_seq1.p1 gnl/MRDRNA2_/MRDRNA2_130374_c0~~gnl/MRDRNA2_/MRDRNA2_130374_c0_seq1.p1  ORF type:complete len:248 (-),score=53.35 gnl/MRDRNA2_/MRDRNA2_130374_c0_seq1:58-801(-)
MPAKKRPAAAISAEPMKLIYFPVMAKGLGPALVAELSGLPWQGPKDIPFTRADWPALKASGKPPFGQLPILQDGELNVGQSIAIVNYIGKKAKTEGKTNEEYVMSQMLLSEGEDLYENLIRFVPTFGGYGYLGFEGTIDGDPMTKKGDLAGHEKFWGDWVPTQLMKLEKLLLAGTDKFTSSGRTVGEIYLWAMLHQMKLCKPELFADVPKLGEFYARLLKDSGVQKVVKGESSMGELKQYFVNPRTE